MKYAVLLFSLALLGLFTTSRLSTSQAQEEAAPASSDAVPVEGCQCGPDCPCGNAALAAVGYGDTSGYGSAGATSYRSVGYGSAGATSYEAHETHSYGSAGAYGGFASVRGHETDAFMRRGPMRRGWSNWKANRLERRSENAHARLENMGTRGVY